jgi:hypothetical protein
MAAAAMSQCDTCKKYADFNVEQHGGMGKANFAGQWGWRVSKARGIYCSTCWTEWTNPPRPQQQPLPPAYDDVSSRHSDETQHQGPRPLHDRDDALSTDETVLLRLQRVENELQRATMGDRGATHSTDETVGLRLQLAEAKNELQRVKMGDRGSAHSTDETVGLRLQLAAAENELQLQHARTHSTEDTVGLRLQLADAENELQLQHARAGPSASATCWPRKRSSLPRQS